MKNQNDFTDAELEALDANDPRLTKKSRAELIDRLKQQLGRVGKQMQEHNVDTQQKEIEGKKTDDAMDVMLDLALHIGKVNEALTRMQNPQTGITAITIENFKGISSPVTIPLRPITLLFGANSAGKSTIIQALHYARELLERNNANPDHTLLGGDAIELGGFSNLVHGHEVEKRDIRIRLDITPTADGVPTLGEILGTSADEDEVRVDRNLVKGLLEAYEHESAVRAKGQVYLRHMLHDRLDSIWNTVAQNGSGESQEHFRRRLRESLARLDETHARTHDEQALQQSLGALRDYLERALASAHPQKEVNIDALMLSRLLEPMAKHIGTRDQLFRHFNEFAATLRGELEGLFAAAAGPESSALQQQYRQQLESEFRRIEERLSPRRGADKLQQALNQLVRGAQAARDLNINVQVERVSLELVSRWDPDLQTGWFAECNYLLEGKPIISIRKAKPQARPTIEHIDYFHPVMLALDETSTDHHEQYNAEFAEFMAELHHSLNLRLLKNFKLTTLGFDVICSTSGQTIVGSSEPLSEAVIKKVVGALPDIACRTSGSDMLPPARIEIEEAIKRFQEREVQLKKDLGFFPLIQFNGHDSVAPSINRALPFAATALGEGKEHYFEVINQIVVGITVLARNYLEKFRYIGPIRAIPDRDHQAPQMEEPSRWSNGLGAWDLLLRHYDRTQGKGDDFVDQVSKWFEDKDRLGLGYRIEVTGWRALADDSPVMTRITSMQSRYDELTPQEFRRNVVQPLRNTAQKPRVRIVDIRSETEVGPKDIGIGVAQALPIVAAALDPKCSMLAVEQPELHLHPAAQARLADLFIKAAKQGRQFILETHSELFILRLLRRIRQTTAGEVTTADHQLTPHEIGVIHLERTVNSTVATLLPIDRDGEFVRPWPGKDGFFEERARELFQ